MRTSEIKTIKNWVIDEPKKEIRLAGEAHSKYISRVRSLIEVRKSLIMEETGISIPTLNLILRTNEVKKKHVLEGIMRIINEPIILNNGAKGFIFVEPNDN